MSKEAGDAPAHTLLAKLKNWGLQRRNFLESRRKSGDSLQSYMLFEACVIGAVSALAVVVFNGGVGYLTRLRELLCSLMPAVVALPLMGLIGGTVCGCLVKYVAPEISGSGIPQVKAFLKGFPMKLDLRVAASKLFGGIIALGVGLPLGREGPTVQVGGATASVLGQVGYQSPRHRRQLIAAGAGAGLAAAFNAPLAGVMFVVEELSKQVSSLAIGTAVVACFFAGIVARYMGNHSLDVPPTSLFPKADFYVANIPFCLILGVAAGVVGSLFNESIIGSIKLQDRFLKENFVLRIAIAGMVCGLVVALLPAEFRDFNGVRQLIFEHRSWRFATTAFITNFVLTVWAYGSGAPGGLFAPSLNLGAALGALIGLVEVHLVGLAQSPITLELAGMGAVFAAVARVPITATVVVFEMTADFNLLLPLMISSITAYTIAERLSPGSLYDRLLEMKGVHIDEVDDADPLADISVSHVMAKHVESVNGDTPFADLMHKFEQGLHKAFPVVDNGQLIGIVAQIDVLNRRELIAQDGTASDVMTPQVVSIKDDMRLSDAVLVFDQNGFSRLPVTDSHNSLVGMLTRSDIIKALASRSKEAK